MKLRRGEDHAAGTARIQSEREQILTEIAATQRTPIKATAIKARLRQTVAALAERGRPNFQAAAQGGEIRWPIESPRLDLFGHVITGDGAARLSGFASGELIDGLAFLCWLDPNAIVRRLEGEVDRAADDPSALNADRLHQLARQALELDRALCRLAGQVDELPDPACDVRAVLEVCSDV